jgi:hypothetical protein
MNTIIGTGVYWHTPNGKWEAKISHSGKSHKLGYFNTKEAAARAYDAAAKRLRTDPILNFLPNGSLNPDRKKSRSQSTRSSSFRG